MSKHEKIKILPDPSKNAKTNKMIPDLLLGFIRIKGKKRLLSSLINSMSESVMPPSLLIVSV